MTARAAGAPGPWRAATAVLVAALVAYAVLTFSDFGVSFDEPLQQKYGEGVVRHFETGGEDRTALTYYNLWLYGGLFEAAAALWARALAPMDVYDARHLLTALVGIAGVVGAYALGSAWGGARAGWWSALLLAALPTWNGHIFFNPKDVPFATGYLWSFALLLRAQREYPRVHLSTSVLLGLAMGFAMGVRVGGLILWGMLGLSLAAWALRAWLGHPGRRLELARGMPRVAGLTLLSASLSWLLMLAAWPWAQQAPLSRPFQALGAFANFAGGESGRVALVQRFGVYSAKLPEVVLALAAAGAALAAASLIRSRRARLSSRAGRTALLAAAVVVPPAFMVYQRSAVYDEVRHLLFVQATLAVAAGCALATLERRLRGRRAVRAALGVAVAAGIALPVLAAARLHPYQYLYYNAASGGLARAAERGLALDYWAVSYREAAAWLAERARGEGATAQRPTPVEVAKPVFSAEHFFPPWLRWVRDGEGGDYGIYGVDRGGRTTRPRRGEIVHRIEREGVTICVVRKLAPAEEGPRRRRGRRASGRPAPRR